MLKPLEKLDILITIFNQEEIIERVLYGIFRNTTTPFNLILVFDGCTDRTKPRALKYIKKVKPKLLRELIIEDTPNLFELRANNFGFKLSKESYLITVQDDMVIQEYGWERRLTYPLRKFDDVLGVTARVAEDLKSMPYWNQQYINRCARELNTLTRDFFVIRDAINRGPIAFRMDYLRELNYLNDRYAPGALDDLELSLRSWLSKKWKVGAFWIKYNSKKEWSKVNSPDSTMKAWDSCKRNEGKINEDFKEYIQSGIKHDEDHNLGANNVDYIKNRMSFLNKFFWIFNYPLRLDKRVFFTRWNIFKRKTIEIIKYPAIRTLQLINPYLYELIKDNGVKNGLKKWRSEEPTLRYMTICMPTHEMKGFDPFLRQSLDMLAEQTFKDFDIVISDHSKKDGIKNICEEYKNKLDIKYIRNPKGPYTSSANLNNTFKYAKGKLIKILFLDDYLFHKDALKDIVDNFDLKNDKWLVTASEHTRDGKTYYWPFYPKYHDKIHLGENTISSPSVLTIKNNDLIFFDKRMVWMMDVDYYKRLYDKFGPPKILNKINVVNRTGDHQASNTTANKQRRGIEYRWVLKNHKEKELLKQYDNRTATKINLKNVTLVGDSKKAIRISVDGINFDKVINTQDSSIIKIDTTHILRVSDRGFILMPYKWTDEFLNYDFIGDDNFSLQSKKYYDGVRRDIKNTPEEISKKFFTTSDTSAETFGFSGNMALVPRYFYLKKIIKGNWIVRKINRLYSIYKNGH